MAIVISGVNNNDKITAADGTIDLLSGVNFVSEITVPSFKVGSNIQFGNAGIITATTLVGNVTGNVNHTSNLLLQISGSEKLRIANSGAFGLNGTNYGTSGQVLTSQGSGTSPVWSTVTGTTINNNSDNRVITGEGGTTLNGEANLTFDGSTLGLTGDIDVDGHTELDNINISGVSTHVGLSQFQNTINLTHASAGQNYIYFNEDLQFAKNGTGTRLKIDSTGGVIIGTGNHSNTMSEFGSNTGGLTIDDAGVSNTGLRLSHGNDDTYLIQSNNSNFYISQYGTGNMIFGVGASGNERLRITSAGNILINNSNGGAEAINLVGNGGGILISRSASGSPNDGQTLGDLGFNSYSSSQTCSSADVLIRGQADGNHSGSSAGSALLLFTKPSSTGPGSAATERLRITKDGHTIPGSDNAYDLGSSTNRWRDLYIADAHFSNRDSSNDVDGTWGDWTLQEGENDIYMINNRTGKKFAIIMKEVS